VQEGIQSIRICTTADPTERDGAAVHNGGSMRMGPTGAHH
jgi:hypothetical protein